ncbi:MAG: diaminopimelate epimerase [Halobacteria archaeon]|nr:diaminopimelate epimerase [Halobacteria archaeon]
MTEFTKAHGNGNDFLIVDEWDSEAVGDKEGFASEYCERRFGVGGDGVLFLQKPESRDNDVRMSLYQPDGEEVEMCGNGVRCLVAYAVEEGFVDESDSDVTVTVDVETLDGVKETRHSRENGEQMVTVDMGEPSFDPEDVPAERRIVEEEIGGYSLTSCNTGVPHSVVFVDEADEIDVEEEAPGIRHADVFPEGSNVNFASPTQDGYKIRTFERGVEGETLSCGTGSVAVGAVARELGKTDDDGELRIQTRGGDLWISFEDGSAMMKGPAEIVYEGEV